jgi:hypothetical protein
VNESPNPLPIDRFLVTLQIVSREGMHLAYSTQRLYAESIDAHWVESLAERPELGERLEAFASRYGRMQDTIADKLLPRWLQALAEQPGSQIETLNRAERLGVVESARTWLEARKLRNQLVHEYMDNPADFAENIRLAQQYSHMLIETYNRIRNDASERMGLTANQLPPAVELPVML